MREPLNVLIIEDDPSDRKLIADLMAKTSPHFNRLEYVDSIKTAKQVYEETSFDVVLLDLRLPDAKGLSGLAHFIERKASVVVLTGVDDPELPFDAVEAGAQDYLLKQHLTGERLATSLRFAALRGPSQPGAPSDNPELRAFAGSVSHELRAPLRHVSRFAQMLSEHLIGKLELEPQTWLEEIVQGSDRARLILKELSVLSRLSPEPLCDVPLEEVLSEVVERFQEQIEQRQAQLEIAGLPVVRGVRPQLVELFASLFSNALKFSNQPPQIHVHADSNNQGWVISVEDRGIGFDPAQATKIFDPFQRLNSRDQYPGSGLGLSVARRVMELHKGNIWAKSKPQEGATFRIHFPK